MTLSNTVLIGDDSIVVREVLRWHLEEQGFAVAETADGDEVVRLAMNLRPAVIVLGVELESIDGYAALARLKGHAEIRDTPVVFITGHTETEDLVEGLRL